ncbi:MAG: hypothetical protein D6704_10485 [Nitrospirae bacterium]|nr:MAG: hypothetical protein D6704_10485 [Nitrospirota bacterium]
MRRTRGKPHNWWRRGVLWAVWTVCLVAGLLASAGAQPEQQVMVTIRNFTFETTQMPLQLHLPTVIHIKNEDEVRHDFGSSMFEGTYTRVETLDTSTYGRGIGGVFLDPGAEVEIRFTIDKPGRYKFQCSIHPEMTGEILLLTVGAV